MARAPGLVVWICVVGVLMLCGVRGWERLRLETEDGVTCEPTALEAGVVEGVACSHRECAAIMLQRLPSALVENVRVATKTTTATTGSSSSSSSRFASAYLCRVQRQDPPPEECYCYAPRFALHQFREKWRSPDKNGRAQYGLTVVGDSTLRVHSAFMETLIGEPEAPEKMSASSVLLGEVQRRMERMDLNESVALVATVRGWKKRTRSINSQTMVTKSHLLPNITAETVCPRHGTKTGLILVNWGLHMLQFEPMREEPKAALFYAYQDLVAGYLLAHLNAALQCETPTFVAWRANNVICDRMNVLLRYGNPREYSELREALNISQSNVNVTPHVVEEIHRMAAGKARPGQIARSVPELAQALLPILSPSRTGPAALLATLDGFGSEMIKTIADMAQRRTHQYLLQSTERQSYVEAEARHPRVVPGAPPRHADPAAFTPESFARHRLPPDNNQFTLTDLAYFIRKWTTQSFAPASSGAATATETARGPVPAAGSQRHKRKAALHHLPPLDVFYTSQVYCEGTENDARHYMGMQFTETRAVHEAMRFLEQAVVAHEHESRV